MKLLQKILKKLAIRLMVVTGVFACIHYSMVEDNSLLDNATLFYYFSAVFFFITAWEISDRLIKKHVKKNRLNSLDWRDGLLILAATLFIMIPIFAIVYYIAIFYFRDNLGINCGEGGPIQQFITDMLRATTLTITVSVFNLFYFSNQVKKQVQNRMQSLEKELVTSKYKSLKSQISPHFLFNSLNTLTALMYEDRDLASDFTNRLALCYRYILDNRDKDLIPLNKELDFLDSFIFMMNIRHNMSLKISTHINLNTKDYVIPTLSIQMLLENALKHNYYSKEKPMLISITNTEEMLIVENTFRKRENVKNSTQLGLKNIKKRFGFYSNTKVRIEKTDSIFRVELPLLSKDIEMRPPLTIVS
ncbi:histidine kinase [Aquimarina sp. U1-2]|uniref:sensor histidine kinase n=1 Tax=Aquimarina sp. U1-2 TaxID=2823141 RepID=UPI001AECFA0E|nr:histidine kinase [Aquimarina sp. U1-2]MBP2831516.1 histidine kinase [Aquimarina sp. U1-2]